MNEKANPHIVFNAMSLRPGGGLTVLLGVIDGLVSQANVKYRISVICSAEDTRAAIANQQKVARDFQTLFLDAVVDAENGQGLTAGFVCVGEPICRKDFLPPDRLSS